MKKMRSGRQLIETFMSRIGLLLIGFFFLCGTFSGVPRNLALRNLLLVASVLGMGLTLFSALIIGLMFRDVAAEFAFADEVVFQENLRKIFGREYERFDVTTEGYAVYKPKGDKSASDASWICVRIVGNKATVIGQAQWIYRFRMRLQKV